MQRFQMNKRPYPLSKMYGLLEPGPVVLLTTQWKGRTNVMTMSWHMMMEFDPPLVACIVSNRNHTFDILRETKECAINIPAVELAKKVVACGNVSGRDVDKFNKYRLTAVPAASVNAPLIAECYANLECRVIDTRMVELYCMFLLEVVKAWIDPATKRARTLHHLGMGEFMVAGTRLKLQSKMK
jgi:flavin reductase (DIM6/NTAB) family NADH-FMN oxidoreductase RutF